RPAIDTGRDGGKGDSGGSESVGDGERVAEAVCKQRRLVLGLRVRRPDRVDHPACLEPPSRGCDGLAGRQTAGILLLPGLATFSQNLRPSAAMDCSIDPAAAHQAVICRVDDSVDVLFGDVALREGDARNMAPPAVRPTWLESSIPPPIRWHDTRRKPDEQRSVGSAQKRCTEL